MSDDTTPSTPPKHHVPDSSSRRACLACDRDSNETPLICLEYRGAPLWICPKHMPLLIHQPERLVGRLPGAEHLAPGKPP